MKKMRQGLLRCEGSEAPALQQIMEAGKIDLANYHEINDHYHLILLRFLKITNIVVII